MENKQTEESICHPQRDEEKFSSAHNKTIAVERLLGVVQHLAKSRVDLFCVFERAVNERIDETNPCVEENEKDVAGQKDIYLFEFPELVEDESVGQIEEVTLVDANIPMNENPERIEENPQLFAGYDFEVVEDDFIFELEQTEADPLDLSMSRLARRKQIEPPKKRRVFPIFAWIFGLTPFVLIIALYFYTQSLIIIEKPIPHLGEKVIIHLPEGTTVYTYENLIVYEHDKFYYEGDRNKIDLTGGKVVYEEWE